MRGRGSSGAASTADSKILRDSSRSPACRSPRARSRSAWIETGVGTAVEAPGSGAKVAGGVISRLAVGVGVDRLPPIGPPARRLTVGSAIGVSEVGASVGAPKSEAGAGVRGLTVAVGASIGVSPQAVACAASAMPMNKVASARQRRTAGPTDRSLTAVPETPWQSQIRPGNRVPPTAQRTIPARADPWRAHAP